MEGTKIISAPHIYRSYTAACSESGEGHPPGENDRRRVTTREGDGDVRECHADSMPLKRTTRGAMALSPLSFITRTGYKVPTVLLLSRSPFPLRPSLLHLQSIYPLLDPHPISLRRSPGMLDRGEEYPHQAAEGNDEKFQVW